LAKTNDILREVELHGTDSLKYIVYKPKEGIHDILNEGLKKDDQIWTRPTFPDFSKLTKAECQALYIREIRRIRFGVYCWIGGDLEYISGKHYFGLTHWLLKDSSSEYLIYTQTQRDIFYFLELCDRDIRCAGAIIFSLKRLGKSEIAQIEMYGEGLLSDSGVFVVQALNDDEAADIFGKTHYANENLHNTLPIWKYITSKKEEPEKNLVAFKRDSTVDSITWKSADGSSGNNSSVSFMVKPTKLSGIQGKKLKRGFLDEFASLKPVKDMTLANYHAKAIAQSTEDFGSIVVGKIWLIATAENLDSEALIDAKEIWDNSAEDRKDANGYNISMMKRMFVPYYLGGRGVDFIDKFGRPKIEDAKAWYANKLASMSDTAKTLFRRQNPETIADVFEIEHKGGLEIDVIEIIKQRKRELLLQRKAQPLYDISKYNSQILLSPTSKEGQFTLEMFEHPEEHHLYRVGIDATSTAINSTNKAANGGEKGKEKSKFAIVVHKITGDNQYVDVANLWVRPEKRHLIEKAGLWLCQYYNKYGGCRAYPERNASAGSTLTDLFEAEGEQRILIRQLKKHNTDKLMEKSTDAYGIYIDGNNKDYRTSIMNKYLRLHGHKINSIRLIDNLLAYGLENADLADAYGVGTMACGNFDAEVKQEKKQVQKVYYENVLREGGRFERVKRVINVQEK
jgi:hypothetical protein